MVEITLRPASATDAASIAAIHVASWRDAYAAILDPEFLGGPIEADRLSLWTRRLETPAPLQLVQVAENAAGTPVGFICIYCDLDPLWGSLVDNLHVVPGMRGNRIGERLLRSGAKELRHQGSRSGLHLWVFEANEAALRFYTRLGGQIVERDISRIPAAHGKAVLRVHWASQEEVSWQT